MERHGRKRTSPSIENPALVLLRKHILEAPNESLHTSVGSVLRFLNIEPRYLREADPAFADMRRRLDSERGLLIANHPGGGDIFLITHMVERPDVKVVVSASIFESLTKTANAIDRDYFIKAAKEPNEALESFNQMRTHLRAGGLIVLFPSGGEDKHGPDFKDGFRVVVDKLLAPEDMVYACRVEPDDAQRVTASQALRLSGAAAGVAYGDRFNFNPSLTPLTMRIDERYTTAAEWKSAMTEGPKEERNNALTNHFRELFADNHAS